MTETVAPGTAGASTPHLGPVVVPWVSWLGVALGAILAVSLVVPYFLPPFGGADFWLYLPVAILVTAAVARLRREQGVVAVANFCAAVIAALLLLGRILVPLFYGLVVDTLIR